MNEMPAGYRKTINNMDVTIAISTAEYEQDYAVFSAFLRIQIPGENGRLLFFGADGLKMGYDGSILGDARLALLADIDIVLNPNITLRLKGDFNKTTGAQASNLTYASIDCSGLREIGLTAEVELSDKLCKPVDKDGKVVEGSKVVGTFRTVLENWNDLVATISFPSFAINGLDGFIWNVQNAVVDLSDLRNGDGFNFPTGYGPYIPQGNTALWRGVYVKDLSVTLPKPFNGDGRRVSFAAHDLLIDENGVTGLFTATNVLAFDKGNASGWSFSVNEFGLDILANHLNGASFAGEIGLPVSDKSRLGYQGLITADNQYMLQVNTTDTLSFDLLQAKAELLPNSYVKLAVADGQFRPEALLHGRMGVTAKVASPKEDGKEIAKFKGVEFRSLHLQTQNPYLSVEYLGYKGSVNLLGLPVSVSDIALTTGGNTASLHFKLNLALMKNDMGAMTALTIGGRMDEGSGRQHWRYEQTKLDGVQVDATVAGTFKLKGELEMLTNEPTYGDGFRGELNASFTDRSPLKGLGIRMRGMFGYKGFRYWFVDGIATLPGSGLPVGPGFFLNGFGGGITYRMAPEGIEKATSLSSTSMKYRPDENHSLGIKASVAFCVANKSMVNGEASFELSFNKKGGLSYAGFYGFARIAAGNKSAAGFEKEAAAKYREQAKRESDYIDNQQEKAETLTRYKQYEPQKAAEIAAGKSDASLGSGGLAACVGIQYNFDESSFHASFDLYANLIGGIIRGVGSNNRAGYAVLHIDPKDWYVYMGTPTDRIGLRMGFGSILNVKTGSYIMAGTQIPAAAGVPEQVSSILGYTPTDLDYMGSLNQIGTGKGFAFGSSLSIDTGDLTFLILYARFSAGMGFDIMLKDYGEAQCKGRDGEIGINGWYANGQAYAYLCGELGVKVHLFFIKAKIPIIRAGIAALMQAKLPNPSSFKAYLAVRAKVLGIISVNCRFKILIGEDCQLVIPGGSPLDMAMITDLAPEDNAGDVSVFAAPQATLQTAAGKAFTVNDDQGEKTYRINIKEFSLNDGQTDISGGLRWNDTHDAVSFYSDEVLPPQKEVTATVRVNFEELKNGHWNVVYTGGQEAIESKTVHFRTGDAPKDIPLQNVEYAYPVIGQKYYLKGESQQGYIQLKRGQSYLFPTDLKNQIVYEGKSGGRQAIDFRYNESRKRIDYIVPEIKNGEAYTLTVTSLSGGTDNPVTGDSVTSVISSGDDGDITLAGKQAAAATRTDIGKTLLTYDFTASRYNTLAEKIHALNKKNPIATSLSSSLLMFGYRMEGMEPFDLADLTGTEQTARQPLVDVRATLDDDFYKKHIYPLVYEGYPIGGRFRVTRTDVDSIGVPPVKALPLRSDYLSEIEAGNYRGITTTLFPYHYNLPAVYSQDFTDLQSQVVNALLGKGGAMYDRFLLGTYPFILPGKYTIRMQYVMPGGIKGTETTFDYENAIQ
ncbi:MAG: hypothetical protein LBN24_02805 [Mediterranea sp.]|nr:hypothetical protein [Mediterranea sp.]